MQNNLTDERLRNWLDSNQLARERLSVAILQTNHAYSDIQPRHPRGGPDKGRDIEAIYQNKTIFIAVGFINSSTDSAADRRKAISKFKQDLKNAQKNDKSLVQFCFISNVNLTITQKQNLLKHANSQGIDFCDIFDRERMRIVLDSPDGLSIRYQYLQISLSDAEQAAFFAKWGDNLQQLIANSFSSISEKLLRIQFLHEASSPLRYLRFVLRLKKPLNLKEPPHYRSLLLILNPNVLGKFKRLNLASCDAGFSVGIRRTTFTDNGTVEAFWEEDSSNTVQTGAGIWMSDSIISAKGGFSELGIRQPVINLIDLDECYFGFFMNESLSKNVYMYEIYGNSYLLWHATSDEMQIDNHGLKKNTPWEFADTELNDQWVRAMPKSGVGVFRFDEITPRRFFEPKSISNTELGNKKQS